MVKYILLKLGLYNFVKYSKITTLYYYFFNRKKWKQPQLELNFYRSFLPPCKLIFDIGANDGHKTMVFGKLANTVIACDPDPFNIRILNSRFRNNSHICIEPLALSDHTGESNLYIERPGSALNSINPRWKAILEENNNRRWKDPIQFSGTSIPVATTTLDALIHKYGTPDFIKIDVEGNEKNVLQGLSYPVNYISFEVLLPEFLNDAIDSMDLIMHNNKNTVYTYAVNEKLMLRGFLNYTNFKIVLSNLAIPHLEIIAAPAN